MNALTIATVTLRVLAQYDWCGGATEASVDYTHMGCAYTARRFDRADIGCRGVEIYSVNTDGDGLNMFHGYASPEAPVDAAVIAAIDLAIFRAAHVHVPADMSERYALIELV